MSLHKLSSVAGYEYLLRHTAIADGDGPASSSLSDYYRASGTPPGRWCGRGLESLAGRLDSGEVVTETAMERLFGHGCDPVSGQRLGRVFGLPTRALPDAADRAATRATVSRSRTGTVPVSGFDLTFTPPKSATVLWGIGDGASQRAILAAHRGAVQQSLGFLERSALFTRTGARGCAQHATRGAIAAAFEHWDSRAGDPNLHTHLVLANKVQTVDGRWLSVDSRALHHAVVALSEMYDDFFADEVARRLPVSWSWRVRGPRRSPAFELDGVRGELMREFSTRTSQIDEAMTATVAKFYADHARGPTRAEVSRLRQQVTRATRPSKHVRPLSDLVAEWRARAIAVFGLTPDDLIAAVTRASEERLLSAFEVPAEAVEALAAHTLGQVMDRRSTWTRWNVMAEAARATRGLRMASPADREALVERTCDAVMARCVSLEPPDPLEVPERYRRPDGTSVFSRPGEVKFTHRDVLAAEQRLLGAAAEAAAPVASAAVALARLGTAPVRRADGRAMRLAADQVEAVRSIAVSGRRIDVLVGPAGTGKTTALAALKEVWESTHGRDSVLGLAPSSTAAAELAGALGIACENTAKWLYEADGNGRAVRAAILEQLATERTAAVRSGDLRRMRTVETAVRRLSAEQERWALRSGQLVIVDEASLASTGALDRLTTAAAAAGAKLLLVGDHAQLSAVDAGGAFNLLAERSQPAVLTSMWRFTQRWEAHASRALRVGASRVITTYVEHDRVDAGPSEAMTELAYSAWQRDTERGESAILLAADARTVAMLNARAHNDRVADGLVAPSSITAGEDVEIGAGDRVVTRANHRRLRVAGGYVRNGDLWSVIATASDGSLEVERMTRDGHAAHGARVVLPAQYVAEHVDLGYATTTHRAQGITVEHGHVLAATGMTRENFYVAMTRGRQDNHAYVAIDDVAADCDGVPNSEPIQDGQDVLAGILATSGAELSATQTIARQQDAVISLSRLEPIRQTVIADATAPRWRAMLGVAGLAPELVDEVSRSPVCGVLFATLAKADAAVPDLRAALNHIASSVDDVDDGADFTQALLARIRAWLATQVEAPRDLAAPRTPTDLPPEARVLVQHVDDLIAARIDALTEHAIQTRPAWLMELGLMPADAAERDVWRRQIAAAVAHHDFADGPTPTTPNQQVVRSPGSQERSVAL